MNIKKWTADDTRQWLKRNWEFPWSEPIRHMKNLLAERDTLVLHIQDILNFDPGWAESKLFKALPEYLRKEIEDG